jgi:hypothetical protein
LKFNIVYVRGLYCNLKLSEQEDIASIALFLALNNIKHEDFKKNQILIKF